jgi:hypothetical protein
MLVLRFSESFENGSKIIGKNSIVAGAFIDLYSLKPTVSNKLEINHKVINETFFNPEIASRKIVTILYGELGHSDDTDQEEIRELLTRARKRFSGSASEALLELPLRSGSGSAPSFPKKLEAEAEALPDFFRTASAPDAILKISNQKSKKSKQNLF